MSFTCCWKMDAICRSDRVQSIWHCQLSFNEANMHPDQSQDLDLGTWTWTWTNQSPRTWLMLSNMMINMVSSISYNSKSKQALSSVKLRIDNDVNTSAKKVGIWDMDCNPLKINQPEVTYPTPPTSFSLAKKTRHHRPAPKILSELVSHTLWSAVLGSALNEKG